MPCVFISHSSLDREVVEREIISPLRAHGLDTWYSTDDIQTASEWERQIHKGLMKCDWFLVVLSPRSVDSEWVRREAHWAVMKRKNKIVPVMLETCEPEDLHLGILPIQYIDFRDRDERAVERLLAVWGLDKETEVKNLYRAAQAMIVKEDWASAAEKLEAVLRLDSTHSQSRTDLEHVRRQEYLASTYEDGAAAVREKRWREALESLQQLREADGHYKDVDELIALAVAELEKEKAEQLFSEALEAAGREAWAKAVELFQAVLKITPSHDGAQSALRGALQQRELAELYAAGRVHLKLGRWREALKMLRRARSIDRNYKGVAELIADADAGLAEEEEQRSKKEEQKRQAGEEAEGQTHQTRNRVAVEGRSIIDRIITRVLSEVASLLGVKQTALINNDKLFRTIKLGISIGGIVLVIISCFGFVLLMLAYNHKNKADVLYNQNNYAEAETEYRKAVELNPSDDGYHNALAMSLFNQQKYPEAEAEYRKAIELNPDTANYHHNLGLALTKQNKHGDAEAEFKKAIGLNPNSADYHYNLGAALYAQKRTGEAEVEYRKATELIPNNPSYHNILGDVLAELGKNGEAEVEYRKATELSPNTAEYHSDLGAALGEQGKTTEAKVEFRKAMDLRPDNPDYHINLAHVLHKEGKHDEEKEEYKKVLQIDPNNEEAKRYLKLL